MEHDVIVVGAGLAGLACARTLAAAGLDVAVLEASDGVGGRVRTDHVDGYLLDRGFQILLTGYPELGRWVDLDDLDLRRFTPGATGVVRRFVPHRRRSAAPPPATCRARSSPRSARSPTSCASSARWHRCAAARCPTSCAGPRRPRPSALRSLGFSDRIVERFFRPLFAGIQLDPDLEVSSRRFDVILRMLAVGDTAVPAAGMAALPEAIAAAAPGRLRAPRRTPVEALDRHDRHRGG